MFLYSIFDIFYGTIFSHVIEINKIWAAAMQSENVYCKHCFCCCWRTPHTGNRACNRRRRPILLNTVFFVFLATRIYYDIVKSIILLSNTCIIYKYARCDGRRREKNGIEENSRRFGNWCVAPVHSYFAQLEVHLCLTKFIASRSVLFADK